MSLSLSEFMMALQQRRERVEEGAHGTVRSDFKSRPPWRCRFSGSRHDHSQHVPAIGLRLSLRHWVTAGLDHGGRCRNQIDLLQAHP
jgi:hypothetical protein